MWRLIAALAVIFLLLGLALILAGAGMFRSRVLTPGGTSNFALERTVIAGSVISTVIGLKLVSELTRGTVGLGPSLAGANLYMFGGFMIVTTELASVGDNPVLHSIVVGYVVLAFLGQATLGWGLAIGVDGLKIVGWATVIFNLGTLAVFALAIPDDMYIPITHNVMPTAIAVALIVQHRRTKEKAAPVVISPRTP